MQLMRLQEKQFIQKIFGPAARTAAAGAFDDSVVIDLAEITGQLNAPFLVYSLDQPSFVRHANPTINPFRFYGRWVAGVTCNDIIAMGARCRGFSLALAAPPDTETEDIGYLVQGINDVLATCHATYEGGNFDTGDLATVGFAWGLAPRAGLVRRSGARPGDKIVVTGELGLGWVEYQLRKHGLTERVSQEDRKVFLDYKTMPIGAADAISAVAEAAWFTSGMDLSDGLVEYLYSVLSLSGLGCIIDAAALPISATTRRTMSLLDHVVPGVAEVLHKHPEVIAFDPGYDSPMLHAFTVSPDHLPGAQEIFHGQGARLHVIGEVTEEKIVALQRGRDRVAIPPFWDDQLRQESLLTAWLNFLAAFA
jgi:thiamine monophosphate kinase